MKGTRWMAAAGIIALVAIMLVKFAGEGEPASPPGPAPAPAPAPRAAPPRGDGPFPAGARPPASPSETAAPAAPPPATPPGRTVRWKVVPGERPVPPDGSRLAIGRFHRVPDREGRMEGEEIVVEGLPAEYGVYLATAEDGSLANLFLPPAGTEPLEPVSFVRPRSVEILLRDEDGNPVEAVGVGIGSHGRDRDARVVPLVGGRAVYDGLFPSETGTGFWLLDEFNRDRDGHGLGTVDVSGGDGRLEQVVPRPRDVAHRVRIDGRPAVPETFTLLAGIEAVVRPEVEEAAGEIRFRMRPRFPGLATLPLTWWAAGYRPVQASILARCDAAGGVFRAELDLAAVPALALIARVRGSPGAAGLCLDAHGAGGWSLLRSDLRVPADGTLPLEGLPPGRYRLRDPTTGVIGDPVDLSVGTEPPEAALDVVPAARVRGRVLAPEGTRWRDVRVLVEATGVDTTMGDAVLRTPGYAVNGELAFDVPVPADRPVTLRAWHPVLSASAGKGPAVSTGEVEGVVLRLVEERVAVLRPAPEGAGSGWFRVRLFRGEAAGEAAAERTVHLENGVARFGGFEPGRYTLWFDTPGFAPKVMADVDLGEGRTDLGEVRFEAGTVLTVRLRVPEGTPWPGFDAAATPLGGPEFTRWETANRDSREAVVAGLSAGRYRVRVRVGGLLGEWTREIEVDGVSPAAVEVEAE